MMRNEYRTSQLRHAYAHLKSGRIEAGMGVLSSVIVSMEADEMTQATGAGDLKKARAICAQARPDYAEGFISGLYDKTSSEIRAVLIALSPAPVAPHTHIRTEDDTPDTGLLAS